MIHKINKTLEIFIMAGSVLLLAVTLLAYVSHLNRFTEFFSGLRLQYLWLSVFFIITAFIAVRRKFRKLSNWFPLLIALISLIINVAEVLPYYLPPPKTAVTAHQHKLKVMLFNVFHGNQQFEEVLKLVREEQPDVAVFLEATGQWPGQLALLSNEYPFHETVSRVQFEIYSKRPMIREKTILYGTYRGLVPLRVKLYGAAEVMLVASHAYPPRYFGRKGFELRNDQITKGIPKIAAETDLPLIILGDFNMDMWSAYFKKMTASSGLSNARKGFGVLPSLGIGTNLQLHSIIGLPVDHCLVSSGIAVSAAYSGPHTGSDHLPMFFVLEVPVMNKEDKK